MSNYAPLEKRYKADEFLRYVELEKQKSGNKNTFYELINGRIYMMASPNMTHSDVSDFIEEEFKSYFSDKACIVKHAPVDLYLFDKRNLALFDSPETECENLFVPDIMIICDKSKLKKKGVYGAPDLIVEIVSDSSYENDYLRKLNAYRIFGVREYWIVNPMKEKINLYDMSGKNLFIYDDYTFQSVVKSVIFDNMRIDFNRFIKVNYD